MFLTKHDFPTALYGSQNRDQMQLVPKLTWRPNDVRSHTTFLIDKKRSSTVSRVRCINIYFCDDLYSCHIILHLFDSLSVDHVMHRSTSHH